MMALRTNWSCQIQMIYSGLGIVVLLWVSVANGRGLDPSI